MPKKGLEDYRLAGMCLKDLAPQLNCSSSLLPYLLRAAKVPGRIGSLLAVVTSARGGLCAGRALQELGPRPRGERQLSSTANVQRLRHARRSCNGLTTKASQALIAGRSLNRRQVVMSIEVNSDHFS